jgi:hypothetical protein
MDILGTVVWLIGGTISMAWSLVWFLISGWVSTLLQIAVVVGAIYGFKYGWQRAPFEIWRATRGFAMFFWNWIRARDFTRSSTDKFETRDVIRVVRVKEWGDVNVSTLMSVAAVVGAVALSLAAG